MQRCFSTNSSNPDRIHLGRVRDAGWEGYWDISLRCGGKTVREKRVREGEAPTRPSATKQPTELGAYIDRQLLTTLAKLETLHKEARASFASFS